MKSCICAPVLLHLLNLLEKTDKMLGKTLHLMVFHDSFNKFNNT